MRPNNSQLSENARVEMDSILKNIVMRPNNDQLSENARVGMDSILKKISLSGLKIRTSLLYYILS